MNILTPRQIHDRYCRLSTNNWWKSRTGDVRRCEHGRLQMAYDVLGLAAPHWRDLSPVFTPILWWRARRAWRFEAMEEQLEGGPLKR